MTFFRITLDIILFIAVFFIPWWLLYLVIPLLLFYFDTHYESLFCAICFDGLYAVPDQMWGMSATLYTAALFLVSLYLKKRLAFYR